MNIADHFFKASEDYPHHVAIIHKGRSISYAELSCEVQETAAYFRSKGIGKGDRILVFVPMSIDLYRVVLAIFSLGATAVFLDEWVSKNRMELCCKIADCKGFIGVRKAVLFRLFSHELRKIPVRLKLKGKEKGSVFRSLDCFASDTALITFTTGSTGTPKAAKRTHGFLEKQFAVLTRKINPSPTDVDLPVLPIVLLINLGVGATSVIYNYKPSKPRSLDVREIVQLLREYKINRVISSPYFLITLAKYVRSHELLFPDLEKLYTGGAPVFPNEASTLSEAFPNAAVEIVFGSTEAEPISAISAKELRSAHEIALNQGLPVGFPDPSAEVKIIPIQEGEILVKDISELKVMPSGSVGEIIVAGEHVLKEYFNNETALKKTKIFCAEKVYHRTGDSGYFDDQGRLFLTGRCSSIIEDKNGKIYPFLVEYFLQSLEHVILGTVIQRGKDLVVVLETSPKANLQLLQPLINEKFSREMELFITQIPRDPRHHSKIDYEQLKNIL